MESLQICLPAAPADVNGIRERILSGGARGISFRLFFMYYHLFLDASLHSLKDQEDYRVLH